MDLPEFHLLRLKTIKLVTQGKEQKRKNMKRFLLICILLITAGSLVAQTPTVADLTTTSGSNIKWYAASTGGSALATTTVLVNGTTYYASQNENGVESATRLAVTATVAPTPTAPTVGSVPVIYDGLSHTGTATAPSGSHLAWYDAATNGNVTVAPTGINVGSYTAWAESVVDIIGCKSATRTQVTLSITAKDISTTITGVAPVMDGHPVMSINNSEYTATLSWSIFGGFDYFPIGPTDTFVPGATYNAVITITPKSNFKLPATGTTFNVVGGSFDAYYLNTGNVIATFQVGGDAPPPQ